MLPRKARAQEERRELKGEEKDEAKKNNEAARLWISGIEGVKAQDGRRAVYDLSATPFFLARLGLCAKARSFPGSVSDFSLMDAIECGIVKLPRVPVDDNLPSRRHADVPQPLGAHHRTERSLPQKGASKSGDLDPLKLPAELQTALYSLYSHYKQTFEKWRAGNMPCRRCSSSSAPTPSDVETGL